ncbi:hypothetical protein [Cupriavidus oxalaticus]|jgi:hypothetical protein|nr:hypothetical protein [Cupriavidus oxalaticus]QEZ43190.1 hypothetical protein D2917_02375 [Cupriavidus oxalaticus]QRQ85425.1 hypothetical protein JTE91_04960 [Cupriavidus oxalaticus]QRQ90487.1 hypothetical protein JTE92_07385 [Cupriavidus oxalaticus]WQD85005.1 hypothetical protein U0036_25510 [Cupriavidus oxalaticus]SPC08354.1 conserved hypothetical protein [Cupriavidus oxalaticus]
MKARAETGHWSRYYVLDLKNRPVEVPAREEWERWMAENDPVFRRTLLQDSGGVVTTRFRGLAQASGEAPLFVTRVTGMGEQDNESYGAPTLAAALALHDEIVKKLLRQLGGTVP